MKRSNIISVVLATSFSIAFTATTAIAAPGVAKSSVNIRTGPGTSYARVDALYAGEQVNITQCTGGWCYVEHPGPDGWVSANYLARRGAAPAHSSSTSNDAAAAAVLGAIAGAIIGRSTAPAAAPTPALAHGPDTCKSGYVWRDSIPGDRVCVSPSRRSRAANENATAGARVNPAGTHGPNSCRSGYVWREAYAGDVVCVSPARRSQVRAENAQAPRNRVRG